MNKVAYLDCPTGIAGDMCLGALVDLGVPLEYLITSLNRLVINDEYQLQAEKVKRQGQIGTKVIVNLLKPEKVPIRHLAEIVTIIKSGNLPERVTAWSLEIFQQLAIAEGAVHGVTPEQVHFHEVGATDAIVDIVGTCLGLDWLEVTELYCSPLPTGGGRVKTAHGFLAVPVPAVLKLAEMGQVPLYSNGIDKELVTPTGAAIAVTLAKSFGPPPAMKLAKVGLGAGSQDLPVANLLRIWLGNPIPDLPQEKIALLETQIDDLNPQVIGYLFERLFTVGALDVFTQSIGMKKSRPGILLTVICPPEKSQACQQVLFEETTTLGIRQLIQNRTILPREIHPLDTPLGTIRVKVAKQGERIVNVQPEYEDCAEVAKLHQRSWLEVYQLALKTWSEQC